MARNEAWWKAHPDKLRAKWRLKSKSPNGKAHAKRNREKYRDQIKIKKAAWQKKRKDHLRKYLKDYHIKNAEKLRARTRAWYRDNKGRATAKIQERRAILQRAPLGDLKLIADWMDQVRNNPFARCHWCGTKVPGSDVHFDHVIAISRGGSNSIGNLCASCPDCNMTKHNRLISDWICNGQTFLPL
jgi:5-methylcytosine-specific restriction endonuclease McrA